MSAQGLSRTASILLLIALDACSVMIAVFVVPPATGLEWGVMWPGLSWRNIGVACMVVVAVAATKGLYGRRYARHNVRKILSAWTIAFVVATVLMLVVDPEGIGARYVIAWLLAGVLATAGRFAFDASAVRLFGSDGDAPPALLLGTLESCSFALSTLTSLAPADRVKVVGLVLPEGELDSDWDAGKTAPVVATQQRLPEALSATGATQVILAEPASLNGQLQNVMDACRDGGVALKVVSLGLHRHPDEVTYIPGLDCPLFVVRPHPAGAGSYLVKRAADRVCSALLLLVLSPLLLLIAVLIKLTSRGPVLFVEERVGVGQRPFHFYKFRTMVENARATQVELEGMNEADGALFKLRQDPRITPVGRVLRRLSLDEVPQLFNVLKGDMSLVGPRPLPLRDCKLMEAWDRRRHVMLPGMTGLWQVSGRSDLSFDDMVRLDLQYMETWSLKSDLHILWRTAGAVLHSHGAY